MMQPLKHLKNDFKNQMVDRTHSSKKKSEEKSTEKSAKKSCIRSLTSAIIYQQIHGKAASAIYARFLKLFDLPNQQLFPTPAQVLDKSIDELRSAGLSARKVFLN